jgi:signal transduction histidine kinase
MKSLASRVGFLILALLLPLLAVVGYAAYSIGRNELIAAFDSSLRGNAEAIAALTEFDDEDGMEVEYSPQAMPRFVNKKTPDVFAVMTVSGDLIEKSEFLEKVPEWIFVSDTDTVQDFPLHGNLYRGFLLHTFAKDDEHRSSSTTPIRVFYATPRAPLTQALGRLRFRLIASLLACGVLCSILAAWTARKSMRPLRDFSNRLDEVTPANLAVELPSESLPLELRRPADAFNRLTRRLQEAFEREKSFSADAAHELRTPVGAIITQIQAALRSARNSEEDTELLHDLEEEAARLHRFCEALLTLHTSESASDETMTGKEWTATLRTTIKSMVSHSKDKGVNLNMDIDNEIEKIEQLRASQDSTHRIIVNLIDNALTHGKGISDITVAAQRKNQKIEVICEDNGEGVASEIASQIFERFVCGDASRARTSGVGAGLGLTLSRQLARRFGGDLVLDEFHQNGAKFIWTIPIAAHCGERD